MLNKNNLVSQIFWAGAGPDGHAEPHAGQHHLWDEQWDLPHIWQVPRQMLPKIIVGWTFLISAFYLSTFQWWSWWRPMPSPSTTSGSSLSLFNSWAFFTFSLFKIGHSYMCTKLFASIYKLFLVTLAQLYQPSTHKNVNSYIRILYFCKLSWKVKPKVWSCNSQRTLFSF